MVYDAGWRTTDDATWQRDVRSALSSVFRTGQRNMRQQADWVWPGGRKIAVVFNVCLEAWSDGKAPGISPMGNPLPAGVLDTMAISWAGLWGEARHLPTA